MVQTLLGLVAQIPATFWGVIVGSLFSIIGIALTNRANDARNHSQAQNDLKARARDREVSLKRDIYLDAMKALSDEIEIIRSHSKLGTSKGDRNGLGEIHASIAKVSLIGNIATLEAISLFESKFALSYWQLRTASVPIAIKSRQLEEVRAGLKYLQSNMEDSLKQMEDEFRRRPRDAQNWNEANARFDHFTEAFDQTREREKVLLAALSDEEGRFTTQVGAAVNQLNAALGPVLVAFRRELDIPTDEAKLLAHIEHPPEIPEVLAHKSSEGQLADLMKQIVGVGRLEAEP